MTDFELTRLAFKAAFNGADLTEDEDMMRHWLPLTNDGDAFRLAVKLGFVIDNRYEEAFVATGSDLHFWQKHEEDELAATRRAIVRAAAEIGREMV